jgi:hypothetical protein
MILEGEFVPRVLSPAMSRMATNDALKFYLTGSRYMNCAKPESDYDFMVQDTPEAREFLKSIGFSDNILAGSPEYAWVADGQVNAVFMLLEGVRKIHVQLVRDVTLLRKVRDTIKAHMLDVHIASDREERAYIWNSLAEVLAFDPAYTHAF